jgi:hypothetical protein
MIVKYCKHCSQAIARKLYPSMAEDVRFCDAKCRREWYAKEKQSRITCMLPTTGTMVCTLCLTAKHVSNFCADRTRVKLLNSWCRKCVSERSLEARKTNPEKERDNNFLKSLRLRNRITIAQYNSLLSQQNGGCAICGAVSGRVGKVRLYVDHDHESGTIRGLLCQKCNSGLGLFQDSANLVRTAAAYLQKTLEKK